MSEDDRNTTKFQMLYKVDATHCVRFLICEEPTHYCRHKGRKQITACDRTWSSALKTNMVILALFCTFCKDSFKYKCYVLFWIKPLVFASSCTLQWNFAETPHKSRPWHSVQMDFIWHSLLWYTHRHRPVEIKGKLAQNNDFLVYHLNILIAY